MRSGGWNLAAVHGEIREAEADDELDEGAGGRSGFRRGRRRGAAPGGFTRLHGPRGLRCALARVPRRSARLAFVRRAGLGFGRAAYGARQGNRSGPPGSD